MIPISVNMNEEQNNIVNSAGDIFVKAGAGTGKTRTIVELYFYLVSKKNLDVKNILAITFTEKAANEMKERIMKKLEEVMEDDILINKASSNISSILSYL